MERLELKLCNSKKYYLIRASDIIDNYFYYQAIKNNENLSKGKIHLLFNFQNKKGCKT